MNSPVPTPNNSVLTVKMSLEDAVARMIEVLSKKSFSFSAHDITKLLREAVNLQALDLAGYAHDFQLQIGPINKMTIEIEHEDVKTIVHDLFKSGTITGYQKIKKISDRTSRNYWEYTPDQNAQTPPANLKALAN